jgi:hypothetical protein
MNGPNCRWCNSVTDAEFVDVGVGMVQVTGGLCLECGALEMGPYQTDGRITEVEMATLWRAPMTDHWQFSPYNCDPEEHP